ncbi:MAG: ribonuclease III, partial [Oscillospiraceae bacterium]|nr:ribonuclease III [Oscillospiraceae bacterium]
MSENSFSGLESAIGYEFKNQELIHEALSHSSYANEKKKQRQSNERLEFLGDSVLSVVVSQYLFEHYPELPEGELTRIRAALVCEKSLHKFALKIKLGDYLLLGKGEAHTGGRERPSILADAFEAVIAAVYLDGG